MSRLADYFVVVGYDRSKERGGVSNGMIVQRFPSTDWPDTPFIEGIEWFCQPQGWALSTERQEPKFFVSVLTDIDANRHYCACLCFNETVSITPSKPVDEEDDGLEGEKGGGVLGSLGRSIPPVSHHSIMYAPKCLVLVSRLDYIETFRSCLGTIYTVYIENISVPLETLVGNILGCVQVPPPGGPQVRFSIGAGDRQALQPPLSPSLPVTHTAVSLLFQTLGIKNVVVLLCAIITEHKILFHSQSYTRLTEACRALTSLMYPFKYTHVYIPLLPAALYEVLSSPTPFVMGVHSSLKHEVSDLMDVIVADLDGGAITVPDSVSLALLPEPLLSQTHDSLSQILQPELSCADQAFPPMALRSALPALQDKELRAVFLRTFAQLLQGYRCCLTIIRIHPKPVITFHKSAFLGERALTDSEFAQRILDCMFFTGFVAERGPPWRPCDVWDELYSTVADVLRAEAHDPRKMIKHIQDLGQQLYVNENPNPQPYVQKILRPPDGAFARIHQPPLPLIDHQKVQAIIDEGLAKNNLKARLSSLRPAQPRIVPNGPSMSGVSDNRLTVSDSARRLEVLRQCVSCIFENRISDARKAFPAVVCALKSKTARLALCHELSYHVFGNKAMLEHQQFDLIVRLMNCALQDDSVMDEHGVAAALLPLATAFCRKLCTGVIQFAYTCIQDHPVWQNQQFWESAFYQDVQRDIKALYLPRGDVTPSSPRETKEFPFRNLSRFSEPSALEIAAEQMRLWNTYDSGKQSELVTSEESTLYSLAIHFANRMVYLLVPIDICSKLQRPDAHAEDERASQCNTNSVAESDSADAESGFEDTDPGETGLAIVKTVTRFIDKVCMESGVSSEHIQALHQMVPGVVHMHIETLDSVYKESKRLPPIQKPKILVPNLLPGEDLVAEGLRAYMLADGREEVMGGVFGGPPLLPAEGAVFVTNYRIIFKGTPCDPFACEQTVVRGFPVTSLTKEKKVSSPQYLAHLDQFLSEGLQIRSCSFQLLKLAFDEEVSPEAVELFRKVMQKVRHPPTPLHHFAFTGQVVVQQNPGHKGKEKNATLKGFAKKALIKTARKAGLKSKASSKRQKYVLPNMAGSKYLTSPGRMSLPSSEHTNNDDNASMDDFEMNGPLPMILPVATTDAKTLERLAERSYVKDWERLGLTRPVSAGRTVKTVNAFKVTHVNNNYSLCHSYPAVLVVPASMEDSSMRRVCQGYRHNRFPVVTWRHPRTKALLVRGARSLAKGVIGMLKGHPTTNASNAEPTSSLEQDKYISELVSATPLTHAHRPGEAWGLSNSNLSIDSLVLTAVEEHMPNLTTPETNRRSSPFNKAMGTLGVLPRSSGGKGPKPIGRWGSLKDKRQSVSQASLTGVAGGPPYRASTRFVGDGDSACDTVHTFQRAPLYILGEKAHSRGLKAETNPKTDYIPVDYFDVKSSKTSFKKLMRACVPSSASSEPDQSFHKLVENSEWLLQIQNLMQLSGAVVDLMDMQGSSVLVSLEDGWDVTAQISSIAQLCLDPHYRTFAGFRVLIEKEWLAFGHKFSHRSNLSDHQSSAAGFVPTFLQFLDVVHQILRQFPLSFEFNDFYLRFLAYHSVSCRFRTFLLDCELERVECGITAVEDKRGSLTTHHKGVDTGGSDDEGVYPGGRLAGTTQGQNLGQSVFDYIEKQHSRSPLFYNFMFSPENDYSVIRPSSRIPNLDVWNYYLGEELAHGPAYDLEVLQMDLQQDEVCEAADGGDTSRRTVLAGYDNVEKLIPNAFTRLLDEMHRIETELGHLPQKWKVLYDKLELPNTDSLTRNASFSTQLVRYHGRLQHKRSTLEILLRGKLSGAAEKESSHVFSHPHRFERVNYNFTTPIHCDLCSSLLWGPVQTGMKCVDCPYSCHEKCAEFVPKNCTKYKTVDGNQTTTLTRTSDSASCNSSVSNMQTSSHQFYEQFSANVAENRTHEGYLYKRGNLLKGWKQRWFVLDSIKHQLRYYDAMEDCNSKGYIDLGDVMSVTTGVPDPRMPKKADDKCLIELRTSRSRAYNFCASDAATAQEWIDKIQSCLQ